MITIERLRELFFYDPETGIFIRIKTVNARGMKGRAVGNLVDGYLRVNIDGRQYLLHRLAWFWTYGNWPIEQLDHINRFRTDNRISNLRECNNGQNAGNTGASKRNKLGVRGVHKYGNRFYAQIGSGEKRRNLGSFLTLDEAAQAYNQAALEYFGEFYAG
jgi:hypothetical protein